MSIPYDTVRNWNAGAYELFSRLWNRGEGVWVVAHYNYRLGTAFVHPKETAATMMNHRCSITLEVEWPHPRELGEDLIGQAFSFVNGVLEPEPENKGRP